jgi:GTPase SAR1 family protein
MVTMTAEQVAAVQELWADPAIQHCWTYRNKYHGLVESVAYFIGKVEEIGRPGWIPTHDDLLRTRVRTTGIVEEKFVIRDARGSTTEIVMLDVGGQRSERKKWIHCFDNVTAILFVASLSGYDQTLFEDHKINRMKESLLLFENIVNNSYFENTTIILFLNKHDLFQEKIEQKVPLSIAFPEYTGDNSHDDALEFIKQKFLSQRQQKDREIVAHTTCATDTTIMSRIMDAVIESVIKARFRELNG